MSEQSRFKLWMDSFVRSLNDPANRKPCIDCESAGYLLTVSGRRVGCGQCYGKGTVLIRNPFDLSGVQFGGAAAEAEK